ncbi:hypothetical protein PMZ80_009102 [Knufia obscura]|uniref:Uncharacterized protein n=1 Tax=Knufia obscura TaxID=1635080 RepID=A0ABR0RE63_9EURO|nr:hypothetical protein PMZ80_009102 [Knufia obscura]
MSRTQTLPIRPKPQTHKRIVDVIDNSNVDDFFRDPSPHELSVTSEMRVSDIIEDLQRRTAEEIENWSGSEAGANEPLTQTAHTTQPSEPQQSKTNTLFVNDDMVSSPISFVSSSSTKAESNPNITPASKVRAQLRARRQSLAAAIANTTQANPLPSSNKPSFQSFLKRVAKTPPPQLSSTTVRDYALSSPSTPPPPLGRSAPSSKALAVLGFPEASARVRAAEASASKPAVQSSLSSSVSPDQIAEPASLSTEVPLKASSFLGMTGRAATFQIETQTISQTQPRKTRPRSISSPVTPTTPPVQISTAPRRKPLPQDSPLLIPLRQHPAFADTTTENTEDAEGAHVDAKIQALRVQIEKDKEEQELDELEVLLPLPPSPPARTAEFRR